MNQSENQSPFAILYVDDEEKALKYFRMAYAGDFPIITATSVTQALDILEEQAEDIGILLTDQRMPGQQGVDLLKQARTRWPNIVRILTTAYSDLGDAIEAVNSGEILRYVTKPWDIQALRIELRHTMSFFQLRRERDLLMEEKFSVRQRMLQQDRLRDLLVIAGGLKNLRNSHHALSAYANDLTKLTPDHSADPADLELWGLSVSETHSLMSFNDRLQTLDRSIDTQPEQTVSVDEMLRADGIQIDGKAPTVTGDAALLQQLCSSLANLCGRSAVAQTAAVETEQNGTAARILLTADRDAIKPFGKLDSTTKDIELLSAYLLAWHQGGSFGVNHSDTGLLLELSLPTTPPRTLLAEPEPDWLEEQFAQLEFWN